MKSVAHIPTPSSRRIAIHVKPAAERALRNGHPWLYDHSIRDQSRAGQTGDLGVVFDGKNRFLAIGLYDTGSPIRLRILQHKTPAPIDRAWYQGRLVGAAKIRSPLPNTFTDGYRLIHGENDGLPGLVVDRYAENYVLKLDTAAWVKQLPIILPLLSDLMPMDRLILRLSRQTMSRSEELFGLQDGQILIGPALENPVIFLENGLKFEVDLIQGQKTGFFLDQRENRARSETLVAQRKDLHRILNVFAYSGGFSLYTARGGAKHITSVDGSAPALLAAERNFLLNGDHEAIASARHQTICGDAFYLLANMGEEGRRFDFVIADPPSFAKRQSEVGRALKAYRRLTNLALRLVRPGGLLAIASCSSRIQDDEFYGEVASTITSAGRSFREVARTGHPSDHPVNFAEGSYLKCLFAQIQ